MKNRFSKLQVLALIFSLTLMGATYVNAQNGADTQGGARQRTVTNGIKMKVQGVVIERDGDSFILRDLYGVDTNVVTHPGTTYKEKKSNPFRSAKTYSSENVLRGLNLEVEGRGDANGNLVAEKVRFSDTDFRYARTVESRVNPVESRVGNAEGRITQVEQNAQRMSGQLDELIAISNAARGGAKAAQETADAAIAGVNATNERISSLDEFEVQETTSVLFRSGSAVLSEEAKQQLDEIAEKAKSARGYVIEITGFTDSVGNAMMNRNLSIRRADIVVRYLAENHQIPLRRLVTPYGYGETNSVAENTTREGRAQNRRVEVKILVSKGLMQPVQVNNPNNSGSMGNPE